MAQLRFGPPLPPRRSAHPAVPRPPASCPVLSVRAPLPACRAAVAQPAAPAEPPAPVPCPGGLAAITPGSGPRAHVPSPPATVRSFCPSASGRSSGPRPTPAPLSAPPSAPRSPVSAPPVLCRSAHGVIACCDRGDAARSVRHAERSGPRVPRGLRALRGRCWLRAALRILGSLSRATPLPGGRRPPPPPPPPLRSSEPGSPMDSRRRLAVAARHAGGAAAGGGPWRTVYCRRMQLTRGRGNSCSAFRARGPSDGRCPTAVCARGTTRRRRDVGENDGAGAWPATGGCVPRSRVTLCVRSVRWRSARRRSVSCSTHGLACARSGRFRDPAASASSSAGGGETPSPNRGGQAGTGRGPAAAAAASRGPQVPGRDDHTASHRRDGLRRRRGVADGDSGGTVTVITVITAIWSGDCRRRAGLRRSGGLRDGSGCERDRGA